MKNQSSKARKVAETRHAQRLELLAQRGSGCEGCSKTPVGSNPPRPWTDVHEVLTRARGGSATDTENELCLCRECHQWVGTHENEARELGLIRARTAEEHRKALRPWESDPDL